MRGVASRTARGTNPPRPPHAERSTLTPRSPLPGVADMRRTRPVSLVSLGLVAGVLAPPALATAADRNRSTSDHVWVAPDIDRYPVGSIALLPPATFDGNVDARKLVETAVGQALK